VEEYGPCPVLASFTLAFALQMRKKHGKISARIRKTSVRLRKTSVRVGPHVSGAVYFLHLQEVFEIICSM
jgi:hypothetical protein